MILISHILTYIGQFFTACTYGKELQNYILSKNPQHTADVEIFERQFYRHHFGDLTWK